MGLSNNLTATLNFIAFLCSIPIITAGIWLADQPDNECIHSFKWPVILLGALVLLFSLSGFAGAYYNKQGLLALYLVCMAILIALLLILLIFAFVVTRRDGSYDVPGRDYDEYRLYGFSEWLREHITDPENWGKIKTCLADSSVCSKLTRNYISADQFFAAHISPLQAQGDVIVSAIANQPLVLSGKQSGCCKPPTACGYNYVNPTLWINPTNPMVDPDCLLWSNDQSQLCYNCESCKAGLLGNLRKEWRKANVILIVAVVVLTSVYLIACSAFKNAQTEIRRQK